MTPHVTDIMRPLDWQRNSAPNIRAILSLKKDWYRKMHQNFWDTWKKTVFSLNNADPFGLLVWSQILDVPSQAFVLFPGDIFWAYGESRQNYDIKNPADPHTSWVGGNFIGGSDSTILTPVEARAALRMKYYALISNGSVPMINRALKGVFGIDSNGKSNVYVRDNLNMTMTYVVVPPKLWSSHFIGAVTEYDLLPRVAGVEYTIEHT